MSNHKMTRAEEIAAGRRRRSDSANIDGMFLRLGVDPTIKDPNYEYRWINDDKGRLQACTQQDDWDFVENHEAAMDDRNLSQSESRIRRVVDKTASGEPMYAYYCRKYKPWYDADQSKISELAHSKRKQIIQDVSSASSNISADEKDMLYSPAEAKIAAAQTEQREKVRRSQTIKRV